MATFDDITLFGSTSLSDIFKQIHKNNKSVDSQISELLEALKPLASTNAGSAVMLMPTIKDLIDVNVKNNDQLIKMAGIAQRGSSNNQSNESLIDMSEIQLLLEEQNSIKQEGQKLLESAQLDIKKISP
jgi:hypothetical protein